MSTSTTVRRWFDAMWRQLDPEAATRQAVDRLFEAGTRVHLFALGKAARGMVRGALDAHVAVVGGVVYAPAGPDFPPGGLGLRWFVGEHPWPAADASAQGRVALDVAGALDAHDHALVLVSGGGSSLFEVLAPGVDRERYRAWLQTAMHRGADIQSLNRARGGLSLVKAGRLAAAIHPASITTLIIDDVPGGASHEVASGPTMVGPGEPEDVAATFEGFPDLLRLWQPPAALGQVVMRSEVLLDNDFAVASVVAAAHAEGVRLLVVPSLFGEARDVGARLVREARAACLATGADGVVCGGETTVTVRGDGRGGRNHELVLGGAGSLLPGEFLASVGTDGVDGASAAAGAWALGPLGDGVAARDALERNDSGTYFAERGAQWVTGASGTNVADVTVYLRG